MSRISLFNFFGGNAAQKLGKAIENHDIQAMRKCLESGTGTKNFDYLLMRPGDRPGEMVPACKFDNPMKMARYVGMGEDGLRLLAEFGVVDETYKARQGMRPA